MPDLNSTLRALDERPSMRVLEGLLASMAFAQILADGGSPDGGAAFAAMLALVTATAWATSSWTKSAIGTVVDWFYCALGVIAILPALRSYFVSCGAHANMAEAVTAMSIFGLTFITSAAIGFVTVESWKQLKYASLGVYAVIAFLTDFLDMMFTASDPASETVGQNHLAVRLLPAAIALIAGVIVGIAPRIGTALAGVSTTIFFLYRYSSGENVSTCGRSGSTSEIGAALLTYLVVLGISVGLIKYVRSRRS